MVAFLLWSMGLDAQGLQWWLPEAQQLGPRALQEREPVSVAWWAQLGSRHVDLSLDQALSPSLPCTGTQILYHFLSHQEAHFFPFLAY